MNSLLASFRPFTATALKPGVPFSTRLVFGEPSARPANVTGNRAYIRAWAARRAASATPPVARSH